ncbi:hypothetical protein CsSME_00009874 [Camellia sinensis var. sinensis]
MEVCLHGNINATTNAGLMFGLPHIVLFFMVFKMAVHVAAQYGQTTFLNHVVAKYHADFDAPDNDGRSPLHWILNIFCNAHRVATWKG